MRMEKLFLILLAVILFGPSACFAEKPFLIGTSYKALLSTPDQNGMLDRIVREAFSRIGMTVDIPYIPTERSLVNANGGLLDGDLNRIGGIDTSYPNLVPVPESTIDMDFVAFVRKDSSLTVSGWDSLRAFEIGLVKGWKILEWHTEGFPHITRVHSTEDLFTMLHKGRIDLALYSRLTGSAMLKTLGFDDITALDPPLASREMFLYLHKNHADLAPGLAEALRSVKEDGTWQRIYDETVTPYLPE